MQKENILDWSMEDLERLMEEWSESKFRSKQIIEWLYLKKAGAFALMTNLSKDLRAKLEARFVLRSLKIQDSRESKDGSVKFLFGLNDGNAVEGVYMPDENRRALCVSTQVGCKFHCAFCLTGKMGFIRNLSPAEILEQVLAVQEWLGPEKTLTNLVLMGMGEPLDNYDNVMKALRIFNSPAGFKFGGRKITLSTVGLLPALERFQKEDLKINLAISLNAVDDAARSRIMPANKKYPLKDLLKFCREYPLQPGRRITFEYVLVPGVNDTDEDAEKLSRLLRGIKCKVNLIPLNAGEGVPFSSMPQDRVDRFHKILVNSNISVFTRKSRGGDILAACGQLGGGWAA
ncbi:MAG: 23S rRNA (adenine(2503)-C(2))-methyltransferase RlmN [Nitrospinae bacterium]|nr:23S rRNA (adenine(2503)-C(2))-methyltransferase RlmN [Nitrospinota bacterium]